jgi:hypothetical protein
MKKRMLLVGLAAGVVAVPAAMAVRPATTPANPAKPAVTKPKPVVSHLFKGKIEKVACAVPNVIINPVKGTNIHARRALGTATSMTLSLEGTRIRSRLFAPGGAKIFVPQGCDNIKIGDVVFFHIRAKKGTVLTELPAAKWLRDLTPNPTPPTP